MNIRNNNELNIALRPYISLVKELTGQDNVIQRIKPLMKFLGNPEKNLKVIHIAGTSGKTSTSYFIASLLKQSGVKVGLTISPHIDKINERVQINLLPLEDKTFFKEISIFINLVEESHIKPSYFELLYVFAIWIFDKYKVDYAVVETGLGGLYDATNVIVNQNKICVITDLGFDHTNILGNTIEEITTQKVGIVHKDNSLFMYKQNIKIMKVIEEWIFKNKATLTTIKQDIEYKKYINTKIDYLPDYQKRNWLLAKKTYDYIAIRDKLNKLNINQLNNSMEITIPARMQNITYKKVNLIIDGAHNPQKMHTFVDSYSKIYPIKTNVLLAFKEGKDYKDTIKSIVKISKKIYITKFETSEELPARSIDPNLIAFELNKHNFKNYVVIEEYKEAFTTAVNESSNKNLIITGSFYLIAQIKNNFKI